MISDLIDCFDEFFQNLKKIKIVSKEYKQKYCKFQKRIQDQMKTKKSVKVLSGFENQEVMEMVTQKTEEAIDHWISLSLEVQMLEGDRKVRDLSLIHI